MQTRRSPVERRAHTARQSRIELDRREIWNLAGYLSLWRIHTAGPTGVEPAISCVTGKRPLHLAQDPNFQAPVAGLEPACASLGTRCPSTRRHGYGVDDGDRARLGRGHSSPSSPDGYAHHTEEVARVERDASQHAVLSRDAPRHRGFNFHFNSGARPSRTVDAFAPSGFRGQCPTTETSCSRTSRSVE